MIDFNEKDVLLACQQLAQTQGLAAQDVQNLIQEAMARIKDENKQGRVAFTQTRQQFKSLLEAHAKRAWAQQRPGLVRAQVKTRRASGYILESEGHELLLAHDEIQQKALRIGMSIDVCVRCTQDGEKTVLQATRTEDRFLAEALHQYVPYIADGDYDIKAMARRPGIMSVVAVGGRAAAYGLGYLTGKNALFRKNLQDALMDERVHFVAWNEDRLAWLAQESAKVATETLQALVIDEDSRIANFIMAKQAGEQTLMLLELMSQMAGLQMRAHEPKEWAAIELSQAHEAAELFSLALGIGKEDAMELAQAGLMLLEDILDADVHAPWKDMARQALEAQLRGRFGEAGISSCQSQRLIKAGVADVQALADMANDELMECIPGMDVLEANELIMQARHWLQETAELV